MSPARTRTRTRPIADLVAQVARGEQLTDQEQTQLRDHYLDDTSLWIDGQEYKLGDFEWNELCEIEEAFGGAFMLNLGSYRVVRYLVWIIRRRRSPDLTLEDVGNVTVRQMTEATAAPAASNGGGKSRRKGA